MEQPTPTPYKICGFATAVVFEEIVLDDETKIVVGACSDSFCLQRFYENLETGLFVSPFDGEEVRGFEL